MPLSPSQNRLMQSLLDLDGAVKGNDDPFVNYIDTPSPSMNFTFDNTWGLPDGYCLLMGGPPKGGKCHGKDTSVIMFDGTVKMVQNVKVGDQLLGPDGKPRNVLGTTTGRGQMYCIIPSSGGMTWTCNDAHVLSLYRARPQKSSKLGIIENVPLTEYLTRSNEYKHNMRLWRGARDGVKNPHISNFTVKNVGVGNYYGFMLDGDHLYMLKDFTVNHNSILVSAIEGHLHQADPDAVVLKFNTELREKVQVTPQQKKLWGIDDSRRVVYEVREPAAVFDRIEKEVPRIVQAGIKLRLCIVDSVNDILGRRQMNAESVDDQQIADKAATLQDGLSRIKGVLRNNNVSLIMTTQVRTEMDQLEQRRGNKTKLAVSWYVKHAAEYFLLVERYRNKGGQADLQGNDLVDESIKDAQGEADESAHKIRVTMLDNSLGRPGRVGLCTLDHDRGIVNVHEEAFLLGKGFGLIGIAGSWFSFGDKKWQGEAAMLDAMRSDPELVKTILAACKAKDLARKTT